MFAAIRQTGVVGGRVQAADYPFCRKTGVRALEEERECARTTPARVIAGRRA